MNFRYMHSLSLMVFSVLSPGWGSAEPQLAFPEASGVWVSAERTGCKVLLSEDMPQDEIYWVGACENGFADGPGELFIFEAGDPWWRYEFGETHGMSMRRGLIFTDIDLSEIEYSNPDCRDWPRPSRELRATVPTEWDLASWYIGNAVFEHATALLDARCPPNRTHYFSDQIFISPRPNDTPAWHARRLTLAMNFENPEWHISTNTYFDAASRDLEGFQADLVRQEDARRMEAEIAAENAAYLRELERLQSLATAGEDFVLSSMPSESGHQPLARLDRDDVLDVLQREEWGRERHRFLTGNIRLTDRLDWGPRELNSFLSELRSFFQNDGPVPRPRYPLRNVTAETLYSLKLLADAGIVAPIRVLTSNAAMNTTVVSLGVDVLAPDVGTCNPGFPCSVTTGYYIAEEVTGIRQDGTTAVVEFTVRYHSLPQYMRFFNVDLLGAIQQRSVRFNLYDDGWRLQR